MWKDKKVLLFGLGILGGGVATAKFLLKHGAKLHVTDMRSRKVLAPSIAKLPKKVGFTLGVHKESDIKKAEAVVFNQGVSIESEWVKKASFYKKPIWSDLSLFLALVGAKKKVPDYIAVTGTRGKTTTTTWIHHLLPQSVIGGNMPESGLLKIYSKQTSLFTLELSSFQLEYMKKGLLPPKVAVITNLYRDHLNRHATMARYAKAKAEVFRYQTESDYLVLNHDNPWTQKFLALKPKARVYFFSLKKLPRGTKGMYLKDGKLIWRETKDVVIGTTPFTADAHNQNLLAALVASYLYSGSWAPLLSRIDSLPQIPLRQEVICDSKNLRIVNDGAATSPEGTLALLDAYSGTPKENLILICGGTDKQLEYDSWAKVVKKQLLPGHIFFLEGSATKKMIKALDDCGFWKKSQPTVFSSYKDILEHITFDDENKTTLLFSPGAASFEKFKNEFDRAEKFVKTLKEKGLLSSYISK